MLGSKVDLFYYLAIEIESFIYHLIKIVLELLFLQCKNKIEACEDKSCEIEVSYLEVYNETIIDFLNPGGILIF